MMVNVSMQIHQYGAEEVFAPEVRESQTLQGGKSAHEPERDAR
jgi:hypothetical protein